LPQWTSIGVCAFVRLKMPASMTISFWPSHRLTDVVVGSRDRLLIDVYVAVRVVDVRAVVVIHRLGGAPREPIS
jgi:hypothetical protein